MRIALLGLDPRSPAIVRAILADHRLTLSGIWQDEGGPDADELLGAVASRLKRVPVWESLLDDEQFDAVIVARAADEDERVEQLRKLIQTGMPILVAHPVSQSMLVYYELDMIRRETSSVALPYLPHRGHPAVRALADLAALGDGSAIGKVEQVVMQRGLAGAAKGDILAQFARDVDVLRAIAGDMTRLGAMTAGGHENLSGLGAQMTGPAGLVARWSVDPDQASGGAQVTLFGAVGKAVLDIPSSSRPWVLEIRHGDESRRQEFGDWEPAAAALEQLASAIEGEGVAPDWVDAARSVELAETIERSLQKSKTIELYYEDYTEEGTFKGTMTSLGCGLLLFGLVLLGAVGIAEQMGVPHMRLWPYFLLVAMGLFLLLQFLRLAFPRATSDRAEQR